jgi:hypothetical protein
MARSFAAGSTQYLVKTSFSPPAVPFTMACWTFPTGDGTAQETMMTMGNSGDNDPMHQLRIAGDVAGDPFAARSRNNNSSAIASGFGANCTYNAWFHVAGVWAATNSRTCYVNGTAGTTNTTSITPVTVDNIAIGAWRRTLSAGVEPFTGSVAEAAVWDVALGAAEIASLAKGLSPLRVRPQSLISYWPLVGAAGATSGENDYMGINAMTAVADPPLATHSPTIRPRPHRHVFTPAAAAAEGHPAIKRGGGIPHMASLRPVGNYSNSIKVW